MKIKKHHAHIIRWRDSSSLRGWNGMDGDHTPATINTIGWVFKNTKSDITVTTSISEHGSVMDALTIPKEAIVSIRRLKNHILGN